MKVLVINSGSSSIKYQLLHLPEAEVLCSGLVERIGLEEGAVHYHTADYDLSLQMPVPDHQVGLEKIAELLLDTERGVIRATEEIQAVGHRVVHGGSAFTQTTLITDAVKEAIRSLFDLAPLHNPPNLLGIEVAEKVFSKARQVAVFDTAFHQSIPELAHRYAIPDHFYQKEHIRVYGFHGTSHQYVSKKAAAFLGKKDLKIVSIHLGNGCSMTAIHNGKSVDHSLGFGPMNGLIMGTRSGDIDQSVVLYLIEKLGYTPQEVTQLLQKKSGMLGLTGMSDLRDIEAAADRGDAMAKLALDMNVYRIKKYIGAYSAVMNGLDAVVFTAGIGENSAFIRASVCSGMEFLGIRIDAEKNKEPSKKIRDLAHPDSNVKILVIPTNEELEIAEQTYALLR